MLLDEHLRNKGCIVAFVTFPGVTNVVVPEEFRIFGCAQEFATVWAGAPPEIPFINMAPRRSDAGAHTEPVKFGIAPAAVMLRECFQRSVNKVARILSVV